MSNVRVERMLRELNTQPPVPFFQELFRLLGLGESQDIAPARMMAPMRRSPITSR